MSTSAAIRMHCLDASALVKYYIDEPGSAALRAHLRDQPNWYTTPFCLYAALGILNAKAKVRRADRITEEQYHSAGLSMLADFEFRSKHVPDPDFVSSKVFFKVQSLCRAHPKIDFSDAFLILCVNNGYYSHAIGDSKTVLITADKHLAKSAQQEKVIVELLAKSTETGEWIVKLLR
jgi:predicted nucleic acid-binding protein